MEILNVIAAAVGIFVFGAVWYIVLAKPWMAAAGVEVGTDGKPANQSDPIPYIMAFIAAIIVAGMMRHVFAISGVETLWQGVVYGTRIGLFLAAPWLFTCYGFAGRPAKLAIIDGGYATFGCAIAGLILAAF